MENQFKMLHDFLQYRFMTFGSSQRVAFNFIDRRMRYV